MEVVEVRRREVIVERVCAKPWERLEVIGEPLPDVAVGVVDAALGGREVIDGRWRAEPQVEVVSWVLEDVVVHERRVASE